MFFYVPNYLEDDFNDSLNINGKSCTLNYNATTPTSITININNNSSSFNSKSITDGLFDIEVSKSISIKKGDYITYDNNKYLIVTLPHEEINCKTSQIQLCNISIDIQRFNNEMYDENGNTTTPCGYSTISDNTYGFFSRTGFNAYDSSNGDVGILPSQKISLCVQYNTNTSNILIGDEFDLYDKHFVISDIDYSQLNSSGNDGMLVIYAQILDGGSRA